MSVWSHERSYQQVLSDLDNLQVEDVHMSLSPLPEEAKSKSEHVKRNYLGLYLRYLSIAKRLVVLFNTELQAQKIDDVRTLLDSSLGRMLELRHMLLKHCGDFFALDNALLSLKMTPEQVEPPVCTYFLEDREEELRERRTFVASLQAYYMETDRDAPVSTAQRHPLALIDPSKAVVPFVSRTATATDDNAPIPNAAPPFSTVEQDKNSLSVDRAILILQTRERGRQARRRATFQLALHNHERYIQEYGNEFNTITGKDRAAAVVQRVALGYFERKRAKRRYEAEKQFLGLMPTKDILSNEEAAMATVHTQECKLRQRMNIVELRERKQAIEQDIKFKEGPRSMEEMLDEILMHMAYASMERRGDPGALLEFPAPQEGGSLKLLERSPTSYKETNPRGTSRRAQSISVKLFGGSPVTDPAPGRPPSVKSGRAASRAGSIGRASGAVGTGNQKSRQKNSEADTQSGAVMDSCFWRQMRETQERYQTVWLPHYRQHCLEEGDLDRQVDETMLKQELLEGPRGILSELRNCVDELVMIEVQNLQAKMKKEKGVRKKAKKAPKHKKMKLKDPTKGIDLETATNTLVYENKWQLVPIEIQLRNFIGPENLMATPLGQILGQQRPDEEITKKWQRILRNWNDSVELAMGGIKKEVFQKLFESYLHESTWLREPSAAQIRRTIAEYAILPLGSQTIHDLAPHNNSILFYGFPDSGKTSMAYAICNEAGANFFNLSPANFSSVKGIGKIIQLVFYVARMKGPSIIYIDNIEKVFPVKSGGKSKRDPLALRGKKMKKEILKGLNSLQPPDRVLLVGVTCQPWMANKETLITIFPHAVCFPLPDYATRISLLQHFVVSKIPSKERDTVATHVYSPFLYEQLALLTEGWSSGQLKRIVDKTLSERRLEQLVQRPVNANDFVVALADERATCALDVDKMIEFQNSLPYTMRRANPSVDFCPEEIAIGKKGKPYSKRKKKQNVF